MIPFLIRGLYKLEHKVSMMSNPPFDLMGFIDEIQRLEMLSGESLASDLNGASSSQPIPQKVDPVIEALVAKIDGIGEQVNNISASMRPEARRNQFMDDLNTQPIRCYGCQGMGHMARDCPLRQRPVQASSTPRFVYCQNQMQRGEVLTKGFCQLSVKSH